MSADRTLSTLVAVSRSKPVELELCCPRCGGSVSLYEGAYHCIAFPCGCGPAFASLAELAARKETPRG